MVVAGVVGLGLGGLAAYVVFYARPKGEKVVTPRIEAIGSAEATVTSADLERSRRDMRTIMVERDLLSSAMMKLYEAETEGRITREEREMISKRYSDQIKDLQSKLEDVELVVEVGSFRGSGGSWLHNWRARFRTSRPASTPRSRGSGSPPRRP